MLTCDVRLVRATCYVLFFMGNSMRSRQFALVAAVLVSLLVPTPSQAQAKRALNVDDIFNVQDVRDPQRSPDGLWVAYTVTRAIKDTDKNDTDIWMVKWDGTEQVQLTSTPDSESRPRWSPDNKYLAFVSSRQGAKKAQVWLLPRGGGEATKLTDVKAGVADYAWSPDSKRLVLVVEDPDQAVQVALDAAEKATEGPAKTPKPIVVDRYAFKSDGEGFLRGERSHLYLFDIASKKVETLTSGAMDETAPAWSPDGQQLAFIRRHGEGDVDKLPNRDVFVIDAKAGAQPRRLTTTTAEESGRLAWSPDGKSIAYLLGDELKWSAYDQAQLVVIPAAGGQPRPLTASLDRPVTSPFWSADGKSLTVSRR